MAVIGNKIIGKREIEKIGMIKRKAEL